jgi:hypothetical protein
MRILPDPNDSGRDMFDGGRRIAVGRAESWLARGATPGRPAHLVVRTAPETTTRVRVRVNAVDAGALAIERTDGWSEVVLAIPESRVEPSMRIELINEGPGDFVDFHEWVTQ